MLHCVQVSFVVAIVAAYHHLQVANLAYTVNIDVSVSPPFWSCWRKGWNAKPVEPWKGGKTLYNCHEKMCRQNTQQMEWLESSCSKIKSTQTCKVQRNQLVTQCSNFQTQFLSLTEWHVSFVKLFMDNPSDEPVDFANQNWDHLRMVEPAQDDLSILSLTCWITYKLNYALNSKRKQTTSPTGAIFSIVSWLVGINVTAHINTQFFQPGEGFRSLEAPKCRWRNRSSEAAVGMVQPNMALSYP